MSNRPKLNIPVTIDQGINADQSLLIARFMSECNQPKYVTGMNKYSQELIDNFNVSAVIDDYSTESFWHGLPVIKSSEVSPDGIVCSTSTAIYPISTIRRLKNHGINNIFHFLDLTKITDFSFPFIDESYVDIINFSNRYTEIYNSLADNKSRMTFLDILNFRINKNIQYMSNYNVSTQKQYFEDFIRYGDSEVFIDAGGYDGSTSIDFIAECTNYKSIHIFEPSENNIKKAKQALSNNHNIHYYQQGLSNQTGTLKFNDMLGSASNISEGGTIEIEVTKLDYAINEPISFIKMDIEGSELDAIEGAINHISDNKPKLAISAYHKPSDIRLIYDAAMSIHSDYRVYFRHYTEGTDESVLFFMP